MASKMHRLTLSHFRCCCLSLHKRCLSYSFLMSQKIKSEKDAARTTQQSNSKSKRVPVAVKLLAKRFNVNSSSADREDFSRFSESELKDALDDIYKEKNVSDDEQIHEVENEYDEAVHTKESKIDPVLGFDYVETLQLDEDDTHFSMTKQKHRKQSIVGNPDPAVPKSEVPCSGCGAMLHCQDPVVPGYMPSEKFQELTQNELKLSVCQRCHMMNNFNMCLNVKVDADEYPKIISRIKSIRALVVVLVDLTDIRNSIFPNLLTYIGRRRPLYIVGNKVDLIPKDTGGYLQRVKDTLYEECVRAGLDSETNNIKHMCLVSSKTGYGVEELITRLIRDWKREGHVFLIGCTNVGKSSLFNALLKSDYCKANVRDIIQRATISVWPGTTLNLLKFPIIQPEGWRVKARIERLMSARSAHQEERKLRKSLLDDRGDDKYALLQSNLQTTDFRGMTERKKEKEADEFKGQELVSFSLSSKGVLREISGRSRIDEEEDVDISVVDKLQNSRWTYDTPGVVNPEQIINLLTPEELQIVLPKSLFRPRVFVLNPLQTMFVSGLGRIDYCQGLRSIFLTVHCSPNLPVEVVHTAEADDFYSTQSKSKLIVPMDDESRLETLPPLEARDVRLTGVSWDKAVADIQLSSLGWVSVMAYKDDEVILQAYTPGCRGCYVRQPALLPNVLAFRGERIKRTSRFTTKRLKFAC